MSRDPMMSDDASREIRWRVLAFSMLGLVGVVVLLALTPPGGVDHQRVASKASDTLAASELGWRHVPVLFVAGLAAGILSGMIGMGGGVLKIAFMLLFLRFDMYFARAVSLVTMFFSSSSALRTYYRGKLIVWPIALRMMMMAIPAVMLAAVLGSDLSEGKLKTVFAIFVIFLGFNTLAFVLGDPEERGMSHTFEDHGQDRHAYVSASIGALHGFFCGLLGISGGVVATPMQQLTLRVPLRNAIANTLFVSTVVTLLAGALVVATGISRHQFTAEHVLFVDFCMGTGATIGASIGTRLGERCNVSALRLLFVVLTMTAGISILW